MISLKIVFLDEEEAYLKRLQEYLVCKKEMFFKVWTFSSAEAFLKWEKENQSFDAVVMTAPFFEKLEDFKIRAKKILLCEGSPEEERLTCPFVAKYQSAQKLFAQISGMLWQQEMDDAACAPKKSSEMIGIYSPTHHESQMLFGMTMAQILGEEQNVLYVNLIGHSGFYQMTDTASGEDIGDLLYGIRDNGHDFAAGLHRIRQSYRNFDYIPPMVNPEHLSEISRDLYEKLLAALKTRSGYDIVLVDFGMVFLGFARMTSLFGSFYCIGEEGARSRYQMEEFFEYLKKEDAYAMERIRQVYLSGRTVLPEEGNPIKNSLYGSLGDSVRKCLCGGMRIGE